MKSEYRPHVGLEACVYISTLDGLSLNDGGVSSDEDRPRRGPRKHEMIMKKLVTVQAYDSKESMCSFGHRRSGVHMPLKLDEVSLVQSSPLRQALRAAPLQPAKGPPTGRLERMETSTGRYLVRLPGLLPQLTSGPIHHHLGLLSLTR